MSRKKKTIPEEYNAPFATALRRLMKDKQLSQYDVAEKIGKTHQTISQYANGKSEPGYSTLVQLADIFEVSTDYLLGRTNDPKLKPAAVDDLGLSPEAVNWIHSIKRSSEPDEYGYVAREGLIQRTNLLLDNPKFHALVEDICGMIDAVEAKRLFDTVPFGTSYDAAIQEINEQHTHSESVLSYLKAQNMLNGSNIPDAITDAFMFGFDVTDVVSHKVSQSFNTLLADIRENGKTEKDTPGR